MMPELSILWRGPLDSCNYGCGYCPFAKHPSRPEVLARDRQDFTRFIEWVRDHPDRPLRILCTPWGEALVHAWYREGLAALSHLPQVRQVGIQTNGSASWNWLADAVAERLGLWITWHPTEITAERFVAQLAPVFAAGVPCSIGGVGVPAHVPLLEDLRHRLPAAVPMWINALRPLPAYQPDELARLTRIDPHFDLTLRAHASRGKSCRTGNAVITVDGDGDVRRCHFVDDVFGNLYRDGLASILAERPCPRRQCDCFIGFAHLEELDLARVYGDGLLPRIRQGRPASDPTAPAGSSRSA